MTPFIPTLDLARKMIAEQFPEYTSLPITDVEKQGHDVSSISVSLALFTMPISSV